MTRPPEQRLLTEANAATYAQDNTTGFGAAVEVVVNRMAGAVIPDPDDADALLVTTTGGAIAADPADADALIITT
jgi:hypothetical protein